MDREQLRTILWLRWRLTRNQWSRTGGVGAILAALVSAAAVVLSVVGFFGGLALGALGLTNAEPIVLMGIWTALTVAFLFFWTIGLIQELQRSETIDLQRLMHLPVRLGQIFVVNYVASHLALSVLMFVPAMTGLSIGLAVSRGPSMLLLLPLSLSMVLMVTAWTYYLRGWLATLMSNPRRRRAVIMGLTAGLILIFQAPNIYFNLIQRQTRSSSSRRAPLTDEERAARDASRQANLERLQLAEKVVPPLWVAAGAEGLAEGHAVPAVLGLLGCGLIAAAGLRLAYRGTLRFYMGESGGSAPVRQAVPVVTSTGPATTPAGPLMVERTLPGVPEEAAALALTTLRSMLRAPEVKMQWGTSFILMLLIGGPLLFRSSSSVPEYAGPFIATGVILFTVFMSVQYVANQFGFDRDGFRALVLSPTDRRLLLLGKNLASLPASAIFGAVLLVAVSFWLRLSPLVFAASLLQLAAVLLIAGLGGNVLSILVPYRIQAGSMKPTKMPGLAMLVLVVSQMAFPLLMTPAFLPPLVGFLWARVGGPPASVVNLLLSFVLAAVTVVLYRRLLGPLGRLLQKRETRILETVTAGIE